MLIEDRFALADASALAVVAADSGRRGAMGVLRQAIVGPWAGQQGGGEGWEVEVDLHLPTLEILGDDVGEGPAFRMRGGRIVVERSRTDVKDGQQFVAEWSGCDAVITTPCGRGRDTRGGTLWAPITGKLVLLLAGSQSSRKCAMHYEVESWAVTVTEGHVAAAAALIQRFVAAIPAPAKAVEHAVAPRTRGLGASLAATLQLIASRSSRAAERFNFFRLLQAGKLRDLKSSALGEASVIGLELDVAVKIKHASLALQYEQTAGGSVGVPALCISVQQLGLQANASKSCLAAQALLGTLSVHGACGGSELMSSTALMHGGSAGAEGAVFLNLDLKVLDAAAAASAAVGGEPHVSLRGRLGKVVMHLPPDAVTNGCRWLTRSTTAALEQPSLAAAARSALQHFDSDIDCGASGGGPVVPSKAVAVALQSVHSVPVEVANARESYVLSVDLAAEGVDVMLPKDPAGGVMGISFGIGKVELAIRADVRSQTEAPVGEAQVAKVRCTMIQNDAESWELMNLGAGGDVAVRVTIGKGGPEDGAAPELKAYVGKSEMEVSREDLALMVHCSLSMFSALVESYSEFCTLSTSLWSKHAPQSRGGRQTKGSKTPSPAIANARTAKPAAPARSGAGPGSDEGAGGDGINLPAWAMQTRMIAHVPSLSVVLVQARAQGRSNGRLGGRMCVSLVDLKAATGGGLATGHMHVQSIQITYHEPNSDTPLYFPIIAELVPDDTPPGPEGLKRGIGELPTNVYGVAADWGPAEEDVGGSGSKKRLDVNVCVGRVKMVFTQEPLVFLGKTLLEFLTLVRRGFEANNKVSGIFVQLLRMLDPAPTAPIALLSDIRAVVANRVASRDAPVVAPPAAAHEQLHHSGRFRARLSSFQMHVMLEGTKQRSKGLCLSFGAWMTHRWRLLGAGARTGNRSSGEGGMQWDVDAEVGMEGLDVSFNPSGSSLTANGRGLCSILRCEDALMVFKEGADDSSMSLALNGARCDGDADTDATRVRVNVGSSEVLAATEFALVVHSLLSQGSELLSLPADKRQSPEEPQPTPVKQAPVANKKMAGEASDAGEPPRTGGKEMTWKLMRHKVEIQDLEVVFLDDLTVARRVSQPIAMLSIKNFSLVHALRDYVDQVHLEFSVSVAGLETPGSLQQPLYREPLLEECSWSLSVITDGIAGTQKVAGRCDRVVQIALASSYVRHLARFIDTTSHFLISLREQHMKMLEQDMAKEKLRSGNDTAPPHASSSVDDEGAHHEHFNEDGAFVRSALDQPVWIKIEGEEGAREMRVPARGTVMLGAAGILVGDKGDGDNKGAVVSLRLKATATGEWSDVWSPAENVSHVITCVGGEESQVEVMRTVLLAGGAMGNLRAGDPEVLVLCPAFRVHNTLPLDLDVSLHAAAPQEGQGVDVPDAVQTVCAKAGQTVGFSRRAGGAGDAALSATMAGFDGPGSLVRLAADLSSVGGNLAVQDKLGRRMVLRLTMGHTVAGTVPTITAHVPMVFVNRTGLPLVVGYRWSPKANKNGEEGTAVGPGQGSRLILAAGMEDAAKDGNASSGEHHVDEEWVGRGPESVPLSPVSLELGGAGEEGTEELGVALRGSPFWTFLGSLVPEGGVGLAGLAGGTIAPGTASAIRVQAKDSQAVYNLGVQVEMGVRPLQRTMYISLVPLVTVVNHCGEALEVRYHMPPPNGEPTLADRGSKSGTPGIVVAEGKMRVLHERVDGHARDGEDDGGKRQGRSVEVRVVGADGRPLSLWSGPCGLTTGGIGISLRLPPPENAKEGAPDRHLVIEVKTHGAALFAHVRREEEETCLYSVDNMSGYVDVSVWQKGSPLGAQYGALVGTGESKAVALDCPDLPPVFIIQPAMLDPMEVDLAKQGAHGVLPTRDGSDTYIHWVIALKGRRRVVVLTSRVGAEALDEYNPVEWDATIQLPGVAVSMVTNDRVELLYALVSGIEAQARNTLLNLRASVRISKAQVDNQTLLGPPTAFLSPASSGQNKTGALTAGASFLLLEAELSHQVRGLAYWKYVTLEAGPLMVQLQEDWLYLLLHFEKGVTAARIRLARPSSFAPCLAPLARALPQTGMHARTRSYRRVISMCWRSLALWCD